MPRHRQPHAPVEAPLRVPDRSLAPEENLPVVTIHSAGTHQFVYRKMVERPVGAAPNDGDLV
ncbi:MAG TPA: class I SAM-dependent rRNA methyltransferase, partial [Isosphaeraceae bacterium]|nr:class I SAM-dependent rRNA methyltransferase [Isosphaeraceae bacterium]